MPFVPFCSCRKDSNWLSSIHPSQGDPIVKEPESTKCLHPSIASFRRRRCNGMLVDSSKDGGVSQLQQNLLDHDTWRSEGFARPGMQPVGREAVQTALSKQLTNTQLFSLLFPFFVRVWLPRWCSLNAPRGVFEHGTVST